MRDALMWLLGAIVSVFALAYLFNAQSNGNASSWILWEKTMTDEGRRRYNGVGAARRL